MIRLATSLLLAAVVSGVHLRTAAQGAPVATPESQGMDSTALANLVTYGANVKMDSLVVMRNGQIVAEAYYAPFRAEMKHRINSATKAVVGALAGIAIARGDLPPARTPIAGVFPELANASDARWREMTLQHLLDMTSGIAWEEPLADGVPRTMLEMTRSRDWAAFVLARPFAQAPGAGFHYNSGNAHLLSAALTRRTGDSAEAYAAKHLFGPLGITQHRWLRDPQGVSTGGWGLYMRTRDMALLGQLYLQQGEWQGRALIPREWAARAFAPQVDMGFPGWRYADMWWGHPRLGAYMMVGFNRQVVVVLPQQRIVAAVTGRGMHPLENLAEQLQRAVRSDSPLPDNAQAQAALRDRIAAVAVPKPLPGPEGVQPVVRQATYALDDNPLGVREFSFDFTASPPTYRMRLRSRDIAGPVGVDGLLAEGTDEGAPLIAAARWEDARTLVFRQVWPEEGASVDYLLKLDGDSVEVSRTNDFGARTVVKGRRITAP